MRNEMKRIGGRGTGWRKAVAGFLLGSVMLITTAGGIAEATLTEKSLELGKSRVAYPAVSGMADAETEVAVNEAIVTEGHVKDYLARMSMLISGGQLTTDWEGGIFGDILSVSFLTEGAVTTSRHESVRTAVNLDLKTGEPIHWTQLMRDPEEANAFLRDYLEETVVPDLSEMLLCSEVTPIPDAFRMDESGLTFLYSAEQLCTLHDRAGEIHLAWCEIQELLNTETGSIVERMGVLSSLTLDNESGEKIREMASGGRLAGIPASVGEPLKPLTDRYHLVIDPDVYEGGRMFSLEGGPFRRVFLLTDFLSEEWDESIVQGIRADRGNYAGLCIGLTTRAEWRKALGEPDYAVEIDEEKAERNRTTPGSCDYYRCGDYQLRLESDLDGILKSVILAE